MTSQSQSWNAAAYAKDVGFVSKLGRPVLDLLQPAAGERILDLGCGEGTLAASMAESGAEVVAVDGSPDMVRAALARGLDARVMDGQELMFEAEFNAVFSNAALHWMTEPRSVVQGVSRALVPGGRFVGEFGGHGNVAAIVTALRAAREKPIGAEFPWFFPTAEEYGTLLRENGFAVEEIGLIPRPTQMDLDVGMEGWLKTFAGPFMAGMRADERSEYLRKVVSLLRHSLCDQSGRWTIDYVRLRFRAVLA